MNKTNLKLLGFAVFVVAIIVVIYGSQEFREHRAVAKVEKEIYQMKDEAREKHPDVPPFTAIHKEVQNKAEENLAESKSEWERNKSAADMFFGYYLSNTQSRSEYCKERAIDITPFVNAFSILHAPEYAKAKSIYKNTGLNEEKIWAQIRSMMYRVVSQDMQDISNVYQITLDEACKLFAENAADIVKEMHLSKHSPAVHKVLMGTP